MLRCHCLVHSTPFRKVWSVKLRRSYVKDYAPGANKNTSQVFGERWTALAVTVELCALSQRLLPVGAASRALL
jgi:hypothetical protein